MRKTVNASVHEDLRPALQPLSGTSADYDPILELVGDRRFVLIGEASHGTHEFYHERAEITRRLIQEKGFNAVVVEADWPDAYRVNCYVRGRGDDRDADEALSEFQRFPTWMWRNTVVVEFVEWLREYNRGRGGGRPQAGFYGMDLYSLYNSIDAVVRYLEKVDPQAAGRARERYGCFELAGRDSQSYGYTAGYGLGQSCEDDAVEQLMELQRRRADLSQRDGRVAEDEYFFAEQNARLVTRAEEYYRTMFRGGASTWNLRDCHMVDTLDALVQHLSQQLGRAKVVVWAHNSHLGDARATEMGRMGELNVGQLVRERYGADDALLVGFSTYSGTVTAASDWDGPAERKRVRPGLSGSYEELFHEVGVEEFLLSLRGSEGAGERRSGGGGDKALELLSQPRLQRAIGVIYRPETERASHYFRAELPRQFDVMIHFDQTRALEPLETTPGWESGEPPETYPFSV